MFKNQFVSGWCDFMIKKEEQNFDVDHKSPFKDRLAEAMLGESNSSFARKCGVTETTIRKYLHGKAWPRALTLQKISQITGRSTSWLLGEDDDTKVRDSVRENAEDGLFKDTELLLHLFKFLPVAQRSQVLKQVLKEVTQCVENVDRYKK